MQVCHSTNVYNPLSDSTPFVVHFDTDGNSEQAGRAQAVIGHLDGLEWERLVDESHAFFKWTVLFHVSPCHLRYAEALLGYFHSRGLLRCKREVNTTMKQRKQRYLVLFRVGEHVFSQSYNSIRELKGQLHGLESWG